MKKLENYGVQELNSQVALNFNGGHPWIAGAVTYFIVETATNYRSSWNSMIEGYKTGAGID